MPVKGQMLPTGHSKAVETPGNGQYVAAGHTMANKLPVLGQKVPTGHKVGLAMPRFGMVSLVFLTVLFASSTGVSAGLVMTNPAFSGACVQGQLSLSQVQAGVALIPTSGAFAPVCVRVAPGVYWQVHPLKVPRREYVFQT